MSEVFERVRTQKFCSGLSRVEKGHKKECDINLLVKRYNKTGLMQQRLENGLFGNFIDVEDYQSNLERMRDARNDFMTLPAAVRKRFKNDPGEIIDFVSDDNNKDEAIKLGLLPPEEKVEEQVESAGGEEDS